MAVTPGSVSSRRNRSGLQPRRQTVVKQRAGWRVPSCVVRRRPTNRDRSNSSSRRMYRACVVGAPIHSRYASVCPVAHSPPEACYLADRFERHAGTHEDAGALRRRTSFLLVTVLLAVGSSPLRGTLLRIFHIVDGDDASSAQAFRALRPAVASLTRRQENNLKERYQ